ncbi:Protein of unknown function [Paenibacillus sp. NFR01]|nr:Protein of unknown function [Paenibacillus sp. NFR01]
MGPYMSQLNETISDQLGWFVIGFTAVSLILLLIAIVQGVKLRKMRRRYEAMIKGSGVEDLESLLIDLRTQSDQLEDTQNAHKDMIESIQTRMRGMKANVAMKRYNAFGERGNDLSFSLAILDDNKDGLVLTSLYNRENSYLYSKGLTGGEAQVQLSPEEKEVIALASQRI